VSGQTIKPCNESTAALMAQMDRALSSGKESVLPMDQAIQRFLKPGMSVYIGRLANAATIEMLKHFRDQAPGWTIIGGSRNYTSALVHKGMVTKLIGNAFGELYPKPGPNYAIQRATGSGKITIENWSELTLLQRMMAGAMGLGFMVSKVEVEGGGLSENTDTVASLPDPFHPGRRVAALRALAPDVAIVHGWAADRFGNVIMGQPNLSDQDIWGAFASSAVVVTVEKIVPDAFVREHSCLVDLPGFLVSSVSEVPYGAHPQAMSSWGLGHLPGLKSYDADFKFITRYREASRKVETLEAWLDEWVFRYPHHAQRIEKIQQAFGPIPGDESVTSWRSELARYLEQSDPSSAHSSDVEYMLVAAARKIQAIITQNNDKLLLAGVGQGGLAAYLAYYRSLAAGYPVRLVVGLGILGYSPRPGSPHTSTLANVATAEAVTGTLRGYGVFVGGSHNRSLAILGAGQIDRWGNINSTKTASGKSLMGSGGAMDAGNAQEILVVTHQSRDRLVDRVAFVTCPGTTVKTLVTDEGIFEKTGDSKEFVLTEYLPGPTRSTEEQAIASIREHCGWEVKIAPSLKRIEPPLSEELLLLRLFDPEGLFLKKG
jgi:acyl CoA:acetate/3-ketoacid CoA transferase alpha subunit/acyl CoA:acetate/3-ketoacid CoA transferase beta subunit